MLTMLCIATYVKGTNSCARPRAGLPRAAAHRREAARRRLAARGDRRVLLRAARHAARRLRKGAAHLARTERIDRIVALDDFDVETGRDAARAPVRPRAWARRRRRAFRDKLAMRRRARSRGIPCPEFVHVLNHDAIDEWTSRVPPPWVLKPRAQAARDRHPEAAVGRGAVARDRGARRRARRVPARAVRRRRRLPRRLASSSTASVRFAVGEPVQARRRWPWRMKAASSSTRTLAGVGSAGRTRCWRCNARVSSRSASSAARRTPSSSAPTTDAGYFLETSARVGGAHIVDVVEAATGINLWREWARVEIAGEDGTYDPPVALDLAAASCCRWRGRNIPICPPTRILRSCSASGSGTMRD